MHTVAIVGRPNVGKSALFNRMVGRRIAIVDSTYGLTRDRISARASYGNRAFTLVDTGGIDFDVSDNVRELARRQAQLAIEEADTVLLVTDAQEGPVPLDREIASLLRKAGKEVILAANKADNAALECAAAAFHSLGFKETHAVSATHGLGIDALMEAVIVRIPESGEDAPADTARIAVVGKPNVGKSSWVNRILREERMIVDAAPGTTRDAVDTRASWRGRPITLIDTAGMRRDAKILNPAEFFSLARARGGVRRGDVALLLIDATAGVTGQDEKLARYILDQGKGCVIGANKWDLMPRTDPRLYRDAVWRSIPFFDFVPLVCLSAKTGQGVGRSLDNLLFVQEQAKKNVGTPLLNKILHAAWERNEPPYRGGKRCRFFYAAQTAVGPPSFVFFVSNRESIEARYHAYLANTIRRAFGFEGTPLRIQFKNRRG